MMSPNFVVKDCFDKTQSLPNVTTQENFVTIMDSICKLMKPPSPQPINKQIEAFARYVQLLNSRDSSDPVCMDWIKPFVDTRRVTTFLGLGMSDFVTQDSQSSADSFMKIGTFSQQVYPSNDACLQVWNELLEYACKGFSLDASLLNSPPTLFLNEYTNNNRQCYLPKDEPLVVRLRLKNPFPFPLLLHDLRLSFCDVKSSFKHQNEVTHYDDDNIKFFKLSYHNVNLTGTSNEPLCFKAIGEDQSNEWLEETIVDLQAIPNGEVVQSFRVEGIRFQLCVPFPTISSINDNKDSENNASSSTNSNFVDNEDNKMLSVSGFIPIEIRGPRLAITKEQRITKQYALDKRLCFSIQPIPSPLLAFHLSDSDKHLMHETSEGIQFEAYANQILQLVFEVKNIGQCPVEKLVICTNWPGQVSVSEPNLLATSDFEHKGRWLSSKFIPWRCPTFADQTNPLSSEFEGSALLGKFICTNISESNPLLSGHRTGLRIALRAHNVKKPTDWSQLFYLLFFYISGNNCRQFRFTIRIRTVEELFSSTLQILNPNVGLYMLKLHNKLAQTLTNVKMIRLAAFFCKSNILKERNEKEILPEELNSLVINKTKNKSWDELLMLNGCTLNSLTNKVVFGSNQILSYCFFAKPSTAHELNETEALNVWKDELWLTNQLPFLDIPAWNFPLLFTKETQLEGNPEDYFENQREQMLALKILWCSTLVQPDETSNTIFAKICYHFNMLIILCRPQLAISLHMFFIIFSKFFNLIIASGQDVFNSSDQKVILNVIRSGTDKRCYCINGGKCVENKCVCLIGYRGENCEKCIPNSRCTGFCRRRPGECICPFGRGGHFCEKDLIFCTNNSPCQNGGICQNNAEGNYTCKCMPGFGGRNCERKLTSCEEGPCYNGAKCIPSFSSPGFRCSCSPLFGLFGRFCEIKAPNGCLDLPCQNGGSCANLNKSNYSSNTNKNSFKCICLEGWTGPLCELPWDCTENPCQNGGSCVTDNFNEKGYVCLCQPGWSGTNCEDKINNCLINPCLNGGTCINSMNAFRCYCKDQWEGEICQNMIQKNRQLRGYKSILIPGKTI